MFMLSSSSALAIDKVPKKSKSDSTRTTGIKKIPVKDSDSKKEIKKDIKKSTPTKDRFIDRDGDGINDDLKIKKAPAIKKEKLPKVKKQKPSKPRIKIDNKKKETPKKVTKQPKKKDED
jgi:hypothetical protein